MTNNIPLALFATVRTFADGVNAEFTVIPRLFVRISSSVHHSLLRKGLDDHRDGLLLIDDNFYLHLTEGPIYEYLIVSNFCSEKPHIHWADYIDLFNVTVHFLHNDKAR